MGKRYEENHYVYLLQSRVSNMNYIGVRTCKGKIGEDHYKGSSKYMSKEDKDNCNKIILKRFKTRKEAVAYEVELHELFDVARNPQFWNRAKQTNTKFDTSGRVLTDEKERAKRSKAQKERYKKHGHPNAGRKLSLEHRTKIGEGGKGRKHSADTKEKMRAKAMGVRNAAFVPWWYSFEDGVRIEVFDKTVAEMAIEWKVPLHVLKDRFRTRYEGQRKQAGKLKGLMVGRIAA